MAERSEERRFLRPDEVLKRAHELGMDLNDRTLKYYVSLQLLPEPSRHPFPGADGRLRYFPAEVISRLRRIQQYKEQGFSLVQIQKFLVNRASSSLRRLSEVEEQSGKVRSGRRLLKAMASEEQRRLEAEVRSELSWNPSEDNLLACARKYYTGMLRLWDPEEDADTSVEQFFRTATVRERERLLSPLRGWRKQTAPPEGAEPGLFRLARTLTSILLVGRMDRKEAARLVEDALRQVETVAARHEEARDNLVEEDIRRILLKGLALYRECFEHLRNSLGGRSRDLVRVALAKAGQARKILEELDAMTRRRRRLVSLLTAGEGDIVDGNLPVSGS